MSLLAPLPSVAAPGARRAGDDPGPRRPRIALYGHDTLGLGHLRRNLALAGALGRLDPRPHVLLLTGALEVSAFDLPDGLDVVAIPGVAKDRAGRYRSRRLDVALAEVVALREAVLAAALRSFAPDLLVVDKVPGGYRGELAPSLAAVRDAGGRVVLGLRDVLDAPAVAAAEWAASGATATVTASYDEVWVYGDPTVHDLAAEGALPGDPGAPVRYLGYLAAGACGAPARPPMVAADRPYVVCSVGGGADGAALADAFARAPLPAGHDAVLVAGPQMPVGDRDRLARRVADRDDLHLETFTPHLAHWLPGAAAVVAMGGYNSVVEVLDAGAPALIVPRRAPRAEQVVRTAALARAGAVSCLPLPLLSPFALGTWLAAAVQGPRPSTPALAVDGLAAVTDAARVLLAVVRP